MGDVDARGTAVPRPSARVLVVDEAARILLFSAQDHSNRTTRWFTVGGGVQPGETHEQAARRELLEETGLDEVALSPEVWRGRPWDTVRDGTTYRVVQRYYLARVRAFDVDTTRFEDFERREITGHRWWTMSELEGTHDILRPDGLPHLLASLLADGLPSQPIAVDG